MFPGKSIMLLYKKFVQNCFSQYFLLDSDIWQKIRGPIMIFSMKFISLADDIENGSNLPSFLQYFGYLFCGANILFGPWISYEHYKSLYLDTPKKVRNF